MPDPIKQFLVSCCNLWLEISIGFIVFVIFWSVVLEFGKFVGDIVGFELAKIRDWYKKIRG